MSAPAQLPLAFELRPSLAGEDFLVASGNAAAVAWLDRWPDWPGAALVVHGPPGCGKTHLSRVFMARSGACQVGAADLRRADAGSILGAAPAGVVEDVESLLGDNREEALLHVYNWTRETGRHLLMTAARPPARWTIGLADLGSRLRALPAVGIGPPDDALIGAVMQKLFADRQLRIDGAVVPYLLSRMERSFEAARRLVEAIDGAALAERRNITVPLVRRVLDNSDAD